MASSHPVNNATICHPQQFTSGCQLPGNTATPSMTLQQKIYRLMPIEFEKPVTRELPAYIDLNDIRWAVDPRVRPCVHTTAVPVSERVSTSGARVAFYSSGGESDRDCVVQPSCVSGVGNGTRTDVPVPLTCSHSMFAVYNSAVESSSMKSIHCSGNSSMTCENSPHLYSSQEGLPVGVIKTEPIKTSDAALHSNIEGLPGGVVKTEPIVSDITALHSNPESPPFGAVKSEPIVTSNTTLHSSLEEGLPVGVIKTEPIVTVNTASAPAARHTFHHNVSWLSVARSSGVQKLSHAKNGSN